MYPRRAHLYQKNWDDRIQDGRLVAILNAEIPLFSSAVTGGRRSLSYPGPSGVVRPCVRLSVNNIIEPIFLGDYQEYTAHTWSTVLGARAADQVRIFF